jgi:hypothetical protein
VAPSGMFVHTLFQKLLLQRESGDFSHSEKQMSADSASHTRHLLHIPNCKQKSSTSSQFIKNTPSNSFYSQLHSGTHLQSKNLKPYGYFHTQVVNLKQEFTMCAYRGASKAPAHP